MFVDILLLFCFVAKGNVSIFCCPLYGKHAIHVRLTFQELLPNP